MVQRYKFESKSQPIARSAALPLCCFQWFKDTNLKVNHNVSFCNPVRVSLFPMVQRYKFESKSQPKTAFSWLADGCFQWFKDTNLKVNHNCVTAKRNCPAVVSNGSKIQI